MQDLSHHGQHNETVHFEEKNKRKEKRYIIQETMKCGFSNQGIQVFRLPLEVCNIVQIPGFSCIRKPEKKLDNVHKVPRIAQSLAKLQNTYPTTSFKICFLENVLYMPYNEFHWLYHHCPQYSWYFFSSSKWLNTNREWLNFVYHPYYEE